MSIRLASACSPPPALSPARCFVAVTVNAIAPGFIDTELTRGLGEKDRERVVARSALRRLAEPQDVAAMAAYLMREGRRNVTGAVFTVDAGGTA